MNQREAKKVACYIAASWLQSTLEAGAESYLFDADGEERPEADIVRLESAMYDLVDELARRGSPPA